MTASYLLPVGAKCHQVQPLLVLKFLGGVYPARFVELEMVIEAATIAPTIAPVYSYPRLPVDHEWFSCTVLRYFLC